jgi:hypothetical protein
MIRRRLARDNENARADNRADTNADQLPRPKHTAQLDVAARNIRALRLYLSSHNPVFLMIVIVWRKAL